MLIECWLLRIAAGEPEDGERKQLCLPPVHRGDHRAAAELAGRRPQRPDARRARRFPQEQRETRFGDYIFSLPLSLSLSLSL